LARFSSGSSGNPGGRPARAAFERKLRELAGPDGVRLAEFAFAVLTADMAKLGGEVPEIRERLTALAFIADHAYGKAPQIATDDNPFAGQSEADVLAQLLDSVPPETFAEAERLRRKKQGNQGADH
jgi:hypothetical protein